MTNTLIASYLGFGLAASRPASPAVDASAIAFWFATDTSVLSVWNGSVWSNISVSGLTEVFSAAAGPGAGMDSGAHGTKGNLFFPAFNCSIYKITAFLGTVSASDSIQVSIWTLSSATANLGTLVASKSVTATGNNFQCVWDFSASPVALTAGQRYAILVTDLTATGTTILNIGIVSTTPNLPFYSDLGATFNGGNDLGLFYHLDSNLPATGNSPANGSGDQYAITLIGKITGI